MLQSTILSWKVALAEMLIVVLDNQKQPSELFYKKDFLKDSHKFHSKNLCYSLQAYNFIKKRLQKRCFPVKFTLSFFWTSILKNTCKRKTPTASGKYL